MVGAAGSAVLDFDGAIHAHMGWKHKLRSFLAGEGEALDPAAVSRDDKCVLGCWLHGDGKRYEGAPGYTQLKHKHAEFHRCAGAVIRAKQSGDAASVERLLHSDFAILSEETIQEIRKLKQTYGNVQAQVPAAQPAPLEGERIGGAVRAMKLAKLGTPLPKVKRHASNLAEADWEEF